MTESRSKSDPLSETTKTHLIDVYVANKYSRQDEIQSKYIEKGLAVEEDSITLYSRVLKLYFQKNEKHIFNQHIKGTPDLFIGESVLSADVIIDIKSSWDLYSFMRTMTKDVNKMYYWQLQGYMALTGAKAAILAYCLVDTPQPLIEDEKRRLMYRMGVIDPAGNELYEEACNALHKAMTFGDIPMVERVIQFTIDRNDDDIQKIYKRVEECRLWLNDFEATRFPKLINNEG
jgi:hypothetical protein